MTEQTTQQMYSNTGVIGGFSGRASAIEECFQAIVGQRYLVEIHHLGGVEWRWPAGADTKLPPPVLSPLADMDERDWRIVLDNWGDSCYVVTAKRLQDAFVLDDGLPLGRDAALVGVVVHQPCQQAREDQAGDHEDAGAGE